MVKSDVIKARLKVLFPTLNLSNERLNALADKLKAKPADDADEAAIDAVLNDFNTLMPFEDIAKQDDRLRNAEKKASETLTPAQIEAARLVKEAEEKAALEAENASKEMPAWAKTLVGGITNELKTLKGDFAKLQGNQAQNTKLQTATKLFESSELLQKLPDALKSSWLGRVNVESDTPIEEQISSLESEATALNIGAPAAPPTIGGAPPKPAPGTNNKPSDAELSEVMNSM